MYVVCSRGATGGRGEDRVVLCGSVKCKKAASDAPHGGVDRILFVARKIDPAITKCDRW